MIKFLALLILPVPPAQAFDCAKATTKTEKFICTRPALKTLDEQINAAYGSLMKAASLSAAKDLKESQQMALKLRNECEARPVKFDSCSGDIEVAMTKNLKVLRNLESFAGLPNPQALYYNHLVSFEDEFDRRQGITEQDSDQEAWSSSCQPHNCGAKSFAWNDTKRKIGVRAFADAVFQEQCSTSNAFYIVTNAPGSDLPPEAVRALIAWGKKDDAELCPANALLWKAAKKEWLPAKDVGGDYQALADAANQSLLKDASCTQSDRLKRAFCQNAELAKVDHEYSELSVSKRWNVPRMKPILSARLKSREACLKKEVSASVNECLEGWYSNAVEDLKSELKWKVAAASKVINLSAWQAEVESTKTSQRTKLETVLRKADPSIRLTSKTYEELKSINESAELSIETNQATQTLGGKIYTIVLTRLKVESQEHSEWTWIGIFEGPKKEAKLRFSQTFENSACVDPAFLVAAATGSAFHFKEQVTSSCGSSVVYDYRLWNCEIEKSQLLCLPEARIN